VHVLISCYGPMHALVGGHGFARRRGGHCGAAPAVDVKDPERPPRSPHGLRSPQPWFGVGRRGRERRHRPGSAAPAAAHVPPRATFGRARSSPGRGDGRGGGCPPAEPMSMW